MLPVDTACDLAHLRIAGFQHECRQTAMTRDKATPRRATPRERLAVALVSLAVRTAPAGYDRARLAMRPR